MLPSEVMSTRRNARAPTMRRVWFLMAPGAELLDLAGPWEVFSHTNDVLGRCAYALELRTVDGVDVETRHGLRIGPARQLKRSKEAPEVLLVAGGDPTGGTSPNDQVVVSWLARHHKRAEIVGAICTGAFILAAAGVLDNRRAMTHWMFLDALAARYPEVHVVREGIFVRDGNAWTSAGISSGIDLALAIVEQHHGHATALAVARRLVLFLRRSGNQAQFSAALQRQSTEHGKALTMLVAERLSKPLSVEQLAKLMGTSVRTLSRRCRAELGEGPAELVRRLRLEEAARLLADTRLSLAEVAERSGMGDASTMWRAFVQHHGIAPHAYRERFGLAGNPFT